MLFDEVCTSRNRLFKYFCDVSKNKVHNKVLLVGDDLINETKETSVIEYVFFSNPGAISGKEHLFPNAVIVKVVNKLMKKITEIEDFPELCAIVVPGKEDFPDSGIFLVLDSLQNPGNVGTIMRTAHSLGVDGIYLTERTSRICAQKVLKASRAMSLKMPTKRIPIDTLANILPPENTWIADKPGSEFKTVYKKIAAQKCTFIVLGNEGSGPSANWKPECTRFWISLKSDSLNVSAAAAIIIYTIMKERKPHELL